LAAVIETELKVYAPQTVHVGVDVCDDFSSPVRDNMDVELSVFGSIQEAGDETWVQSADARPQRWLGYQCVSPTAAYLTSVEQRQGSLIARAKVQMAGYFDDYVGMESVEWAEGIFQELDVGRCLVQLFVEVVYLEIQNGVVVVNPLEPGHSEPLKCSSTHPLPFI
jgi:hypothetical protein